MPGSELFVPVLLTNPVLFQGKVKGCGYWIEGDLVYDDLDSSGKCIEVGIREHGHCPVEIIPESIGQFTGFLDGSRRKIFSGNILRHNPNDDDWYDCVVWWPEQAMFENLSFVNAIRRAGLEKDERIRIMNIISIKAGMNRLADWVFGSDNPSLVAGNAYDNPELLLNDRN